MVIIFGHVDGSNEPQKGQVLFFLLWSALVVTADAKKKPYDNDNCVHSWERCFFHQFTFVGYSYSTSIRISTYTLLAYQKSLSEPSIMRLKQKSVRNVNATFTTEN